MGYPFDKRSRLNDQDVMTLADFARQLSNTSLGECSIIFNNAVIDRT